MIIQESHPKLRPMGFYEGKSYTIIRKIGSLYELKCGNVYVVVHKDILKKIKNTGKIIMNFNEYQERAHALAEYPEIHVLRTEENGAIKSTRTGYLYATLGLVGEAGEVAEKIKKIIRNNNGYPLNDDKLNIQKELGDVLWYIAELAKCFDIELQDIADLNIEKLEDRKKRGVIKSEGDNR